MTQKVNVVERGIGELELLTRISIVEHVATETATWDDDLNRYIYNPSTILTRLIKEAAKCDCYSSDLFYTWKTFEKQMANTDERLNVFLFGFRDYGVDGNSFVLHRTYTRDYSMAEYNSLYMLTLYCDEEGKVTIDLNQISLSRLPQNIEDIKQLVNKLTQQCEELQANFETQRDFLESNKLSVELLRNGYLSDLHVLEEGLANWSLLDKVITMGRLG